MCASCLESKLAWEHSRQTLSWRTHIQHRLIHGGTSNVLLSRIIAGEVGSDWCMYVVCPQHMYR